MEKFKEFISVFMSAISNCQLYSINHVFMDELTQRAYIILAEFLNKTDKLEMMIIDSDLIINRNPARKTGFQGKNLIKRLRRKGVSRISFSRGITPQELKKLIGDLSSPHKGIKPSPHIEVGVVKVNLGGPVIDKGSGFEQNLPHFTSEQLEKIREEFDKISPFKRLHVAGFEEIVLQFVMMLKKEVNILKLLKPVQSHNKLDYNHATNVSILTMFQAQTLGIKEEFHRDIGLAALLHDVGKLLIPEEIPEGKDSPEEKEAEAIKLHPLYGAQYLAKTDGLTHLAPIVAFEHHLRYDGQGYPELKAKDIRQHICSQMTAISDSFDSLRSSTSYKRALDIKEALIKMKTEDEGLFNPFLINNFLRSIHLALSA
jgi:hypothetical protein